MQPGKKLWSLVPSDDAATRRLAAELEVSPIVAQLLLNRGITDAVSAKRFLNPVLSALHPPQSLPGASLAADLIVEKLRAGQRIRIFGDYDADGVTGTAILIRLLEFLGAKVDFQIPHRMDDGYGLNTDAIRKAKEDGIGLLVTVDCGITAIEEAELAQQLGLPLVITDHHEFRDQLPCANALVHPRLPGGYAFEGLSGSGVAFKLAWVIAQRASANERVTPELREHLMDSVGLAALGLVADVVPLRDENRIFVKHGLHRIAHRPILGVKALIETCKLTDSQIRSEDIGFKLAPRLNAAGRLGCALLVVELLTTKSPIKAREIAECLDGFNAQRQTLERRMTAHAREILSAQPETPRTAIVLGNEDWHQGVVGIVAGRLTEQWGVPTVLVALKPNDEPSTGSGRSIAGVPLHEILNDCRSVLEGHGGHAAAAGVKVRPSRLDEFRQRLTESIERRFPNGLPQPRYRLDGEVPLSSLTLALLRELDRLEPYGAENAKPRFLASGLTVEGQPKRIGADGRHLSFRVRQGSSVVRAVGFGMGERLDELMSAGGDCSVAFVPRVNEWQGRRTVEIEVLDFQPSRVPQLG